MNGNISVKILWFCRLDWIDKLTLLFVDRRQACWGRTLLPGVCATACIGHQSAGPGRVKASATPASDGNGPHRRYCMIGNALTFTKLLFRELVGLQDEFGGTLVKPLLLSFVCRSMDRARARRVKKDCRALAFGRAFEVLDRITSGHIGNRRRASKLNYPPRTRFGRKVTIDGNRVKIRTQIRSAITNGQMPRKICCNGMSGRTPATT
jgi:hypothetical protein